MVISWMAGGLGNQMFQYAATFVLAKKLDTVMKFDTFSLDSDKKRELSLDCFGIKIDTASQIELRRINQWYGVPIEYLPLNAQKLLRKIIGKQKIKENGKIDQLDSLHRKADYYIKGYWQNEEFFQSEDKRIRMKFMFVNRLDMDLKKLLEEMTGCESVAIHLRRTDYVTNKDARNLLGALSMQYYKDAVAFMESKISGVKYFVFSDDLDWAKKYFKLGKWIKYVDTRNTKDYVDMQLMSNCRHNIIANSSFSWWGAWLNKNQGKIVVAPKNWFKDRSTNKKNPASKMWIKIKNE